MSTKGREKEWSDSQEAKRADRKACRSYWKRRQALIRVGVHAHHVTAKTQAEAYYLGEQAKPYGTHPDGKARGLRHE